MSESIFIDLPNFYSHLLKISEKNPETVRDYFLNWVDFDRIAMAMADIPVSIWVFYSGGKLGPSHARISGNFLKDYISRINRSLGVTARDVNIPGEQREPVRYTCDDCGSEGQAQWVSEKGIDSSLSASMFETMESWDTAFLFSGDADFVPVVASLRRMGKIVVGAGFEDASEALVRECYHYYDLWNDFIKKDYALFKLFQDGGLVDIWFSDTVEPAAATFKPIIFYLKEFQEGDGFYMSYDGPFDNSKFNESFNEFDSEFPGMLERRTEEVVAFQGIPQVWDGVRRRLELLSKKYNQATLEEISGLKILRRELHFDPEASKYSAAAKSQ